MSEKESEEKMPEANSKIKEKVMREIKEKKIKMRSPLVFLAEKMGLESALAAALLFGALVVALSFYFFKKTGLLKYWSFGAPGMRVIFKALPYDYIVFFILAIILAVYFANRLELSMGNNEHTNIFLALFLISAIILGLAFGAMGAEEFFHGFSKKKIPKDVAVYGRVENIAPGFIIIQDDDGDKTEVMDDQANILGQNIFGAQGRFIRAVGTRDIKNNDIFHAEQILCCDDN